MSSFIPKTDISYVPVWKGGKYCDGCEALDNDLGGENQEHHYGGCIKPPWAEEVPDIDEEVPVIDEEEEVPARKKRKIEELHQKLHSMKNNIDKIEKDIMALQESFSKDK